MRCGLYNGYTCNIIFNRQANVGFDTTNNSPITIGFSALLTPNSNKMSFNSKVIFPDNALSTVEAFYNSPEFNKPIKLPKNVMYCSRMFYKTKVFNQPVTIPDSAIYCAQMFQESLNFNSPVIIGKNAEDCAFMFDGATNFDKPVTLGRSVTNCWYMFHNTAVSSVVQLPESVQECQGMYSLCSNLTSVSNLIIPANVNSARVMFAGCTNLAYAQVYVTGNTNVGSMFSNSNNVVMHLSYPFETPAFTDARVNSGGKASINTGIAGIVGQQATTNADFNFTHLGTTITFRDTGTTWTLVKDSYNEYSQSQHIWKTYYFSHFKL